MDEQMNCLIQLQKRIDFFLIVCECTYECTWALKSVSMYTVGNCSLFFSSTMQDSRLASPAQCCTCT